ncbi:MAG: hypothetical protein LBO74_16880 [Candidatus Symbiothrix sp.]|jgi:hypothetical protein|nr:hypothetical protein [Candidatus Symbiothrix sp.]
MKDIKTQINGKAITPEIAEVLENWIGDMAITYVEKVDETIGFFISHWDHFTTNVDDDIKSLLVALHALKKDLNAFAVIEKE